MGAHRAPPLVTDARSSPRKVEKPLFAALYGPAGNRTLTGGFKVFRRGPDAGSSRLAGGPFDDSSVDGFLDRLRAGASAGVRFGLLHQAQERSCGRVLVVPGGFVRDSWRSGFPGSYVPARPNSGSAPRRPRRCRRRRQPTHRSRSRQARAASSSRPVTARPACQPRASMLTRLPIGVELTAVRTPCSKSSAPRPTAAASSRSLARAAADW